VVVFGLLEVALSALAVMFSGLAVVMTRAGGGVDDPGGAPDHS
jgi:hypothetical protein